MPFVPHVGEASLAVAHRRDRVVETHRTYSVFSIALFMSYFAGSIRFVFRSHLLLVFASQAHGRNQEMGRVESRTALCMARTGISLEEKAARMRERHSVDPVAAVPPAVVCLERHYTPAEIAVKWNLSEDAVRKLFQDEPGVFVLGGQAAHKRRYTTLRIPESVLQRVHRRMTKV